MPFDPITGRRIQTITTSIAHEADVVKKPIIVIPLEVVEEVKSPILTQEEITQAIVTDVVETEKEKWTNIQVDSTVLSIFMACPRKYEYVFVRHLKPVVGVSPSIKRGSIVHDALLGYWKERINADDYQKATQICLKIAKEAFEKDSAFSQEEKLETLQTLLEFLKHVQGLNWIPLEAEKYFKIKVFEDTNLKLRIFITGRIDLIVRTPQIPILPIDVKTESERWFHSQMSNQFRMYSLACNTNILGVQRVGFQKTLEAKDKFKLELLPFDQDILDEFKETTLPYWTKQMILAHEDSYFPMNPTNCVHGHFKCQFSDAYNQGICNVSRSVRDQKLARYFVVGDAWDPSNI